MADQAFVWVWLPGHTEPVVAGRIFRDGQRLSFNYGRSYLAREGEDVDRRAWDILLPSAPSNRR